MANIPTLQNSKAVATPVLLSDAAVERAYNRISRGNVAWANAVNGVFDAAAKTAYSGARLAVGIIDKIEHEEDALAKATYQKKMSDFFLDRQTEVLNGTAKMSNDVELGDWVKSMSQSVESLHSSFLEDDSVKPASKRLGAFLKMEFQRQMNDFVQKNFASKYRENKVREKNAALFDLQNPDVYSNSDSTANALELARLKGATEDELSAARTNAAFLNISAGLERQFAEFQNLGTEEMLNTRVERLESALSFIRKAADVNGDGLDVREQKLVDSFSADARQVFGMTEQKKITLQKYAARKMFAGLEEDLRKNIGHRGDVAKSQAKQALSEQLASLRTSEEGKKWVSTYFGGDFSAAEAAINQQWKEAESRIDSLYKIEFEKEKKAMREQQCKMYSEVLDLLFQGTSQSLACVREITNDPDLEINVLPDDSVLQPGHTDSGTGMTRVSGPVMVEIVNACVRAYNGDNPEDLVWAINQLRDKNACFSRADIALVSRALAGGNKYGAALGRYVDDLRAVLVTPEREYKVYKGVVADEKNADKHAMNAYFAGLNKLLDVLDNHDVGAGTKGTSLYDAVEPVKKQLIEELKEGKSWDRRLELLQEFGSLLRITIPGRIEVANKK